MIGLQFLVERGEVFMGEILYADDVVDIYFALFYSYFRPHFELIFCN